MSAMTRPKNGMQRPIIKVESTSDVRIRIEYTRDVLWFPGINSSRHNATGVMVKAYFVNGLTTVVQTAILDATKSWGRFRVNCDSVESPNIRYPMIATAAYKSAQKPKLAKSTDGNCFGFSIDE